MSKSTEVMKLVNGLVKADEVAIVMRDLSKELAKVSGFEGGRQEGGRGQGAGWDLKINEGKKG